MAAQAYTRNTSSTPRMGVRRALCGGLASIAALAAACGTAPPRPKTLPSSANGTPATGTDAGTGTSPQTPRQATVPAVAAPEDPLTGCGVDVTQPAALAPAGDFASSPVASSGTRLVLGFSLPFQMTTTTELTLSGSLEQYVTTFIPTATAGSAGAQKSADAAAAAGAGRVTAALLALPERAALRAKIAGWTDLHCTVQPATTLTSTLGGANVVVQFDPPLPVALSPHADAGVYKLELGAARTFGGIEGTVTASTSATLPVGTKLAATVTVEAIAASYTPSSASGQALPIGGDLGFAVHVDLGSPAASQALGLGAVTRYFLDTKTKKFKAIVVEAADPQAAPIVYITK